MSLSWLPTTRTPVTQSDLGSSGLLSISCRALLPIIPDGATTLLRPSVKVQNQL